MSVKPGARGDGLIQALITSISLGYVFLWLARSALSTLPALLAAGVDGAEPRRWFVTVWGAALQVRPSASSSDSVWPLALTAAGITAGLLLLGRWTATRRPAVGFALIVWAFALLGGANLRPFRADFSLDPERLPWIALAAAAAFIGACWVAPALGFSRSPGLRAAALASVAFAPLALSQAAIRWWTFFDLEAFWRADLPPLALTALVVSAGAWLSLDAPNHRRGWRGALTGAVASLALFLGSQQIGQALNAREAVRREAERAAALAAAPENVPLAPLDRPFFFKGVNFTAEWPASYDSTEARRMLERLPEYGVNAIALVPYGSGRLGSPAIRFPGGWESDAGVEHLAAVAHQLGMRVMLKPQIWFRGGYPGDVEFSSDIDRETFFNAYERFVDHYAELAARIHADVFCVGVEFAKLTRYEDRWRGFIERARRRYDGPLTYAANFGKEFESVAFWDALDYIGLDNYYPLPADLSTDAVAARVEAVQRRFGLPVLFTEAGFSVYERSHERPWEDEPGGAYSPEAQARFYEAFFEGFHDKPWLRGIFWWKVGSAGAPARGRGEHSPVGRPAMEVIKRWYAGERIKQASR